MTETKRLATAIVAVINADAPAKPIVTRESLAAEHYERLKANPRVRIGI